MIPDAALRSLVRRNGSKIVLIVVESLGGAPYRGRTALEAADCPCLDKLASESECGLLLPVDWGVTPGRETALLALLGYDPLTSRTEGPEPSKLDQMHERYRLTPAAITDSPVCCRVAERVGMTLIESGNSAAEQVAALRGHFAGHDFFLLYTSAPAGRDDESRFRLRVDAIEAVDHALPAVLAIEPDVIAVTGDYSAPVSLPGPSWHAVPFLLWSPYCRFNRVERFTELECANGMLGRLRSNDAMPLMLANALKLKPLGD